jgi:hypothetical protein
MSRSVGTIEVWGTFTGAMRERVEKHLGNASSIRGVRTIAKKHPTVNRLVLKGTADQLDRANGLSLTWSKDVDLITRYVPIDYEIIKENA